MFRKKDEPVELKANNFSVGSTITAGYEKYMVIGNLLGDTIMLLDLRTFKICANVVDVDDINFLTEDDVLELVESDHNTFTDYSFDAKGLKNV